MHQVSDSLGKFATSAWLGVGLLLAIILIIIIVGYIDDWGRGR